MSDHGGWENLRKFMRLSAVSFLHQEHEIWIQEGKTRLEIRERRKKICKVRAEIRAYVEKGKAKGDTNLNVNFDVEVNRRYEASKFAYMDSALEALKPELPVKHIRKVKSFPCTFPWYFLPNTSTYSWMNPGGANC